MKSPKAARHGSHRMTVSAVGVRVGILILPGLLMLTGGVRYQGDVGQVLLLGACFQLLICVIAFASQGVRCSIWPALLLIYSIAFAWIQLCGNKSEDWFAHLTQSVLLGVPLGVFAVKTLRDIGAPALRRARLLASRLANRKEWPKELEACKNLPDVKALREALYLDAAPALTLLNHSRPQVVIAALAALDFRKNWRPGQAAIVLDLALRAEEPAVRAAALTALSNIEDRSLVEAMGEFLRDPSPLVRRSATEALLWDTERRWSWIRHAVRRNLGDPLCQEDGALRQSGDLLTSEAIDDLTAWASEKGLLGLRAALTLGVHYSQALNESPNPDLLLTLNLQLGDPHTPPVLRMELATLMNAHLLLNKEVLLKLLDPSSPAPLRLIAVEALLMEGDSVEARSALRELARLPNREIALATADVVQRRLKIELGLTTGQPLPPVHSRQATEISRRVRSWAAQYDLTDEPMAAAMRNESRAWPSLDEM